MRTVIRFFIERAAFNHLSIALFAVWGVIAFHQIAKELYPPIKLDQIQISGGYDSASIKMLDDLAVAPLEKMLKSIDGVKKSESFIQDEAFDIVVTLRDGAETTAILLQVRDMIAALRSRLPKAMHLPIASTIVYKEPLLFIGVAADSNATAMRSAKKLAASLRAIPKLTGISVYGQNDEIIKITLNDEMIDHHRLNRTDVIESIRSLVNVLPFGSLEQSGKHLMLASAQNSRSIERLRNTVIDVRDVRVLLGEIATIERTRESPIVLSAHNGAESIVVTVSKTKSADAIRLSGRIQETLAQYRTQYPEVTFTVSADSSEMVSERLGIVFSNLIAAALLVAISLFVLINRQIAFVVLLGIPTALLLGMLLLQQSGQSLNMISLLGVLLILGVLVDDAIIVAENIQRHLGMGKPIRQAALDGTAEVAPAVTVAAVTTLFAFLPMLLISGELGRFIELIPLAVIGLVFASLIESFFFLPLHAVSILGRAKEREWTRFQGWYRRLLERAMRHKRSVAALFLIGAPVITILISGSLPYRLFPEADSNRIYVRGGFDSGTLPTKTFDNVRTMQDIILENKEALFIRTLDVLAGAKGYDVKPHLFEMTIELYSAKPDNVFDRIVSDLIDSETAKATKIRTISAQEVIKRLMVLTKAEADAKAVRDFSIVQEASGVNEYDIEIGLYAEAQADTETAATQLRDALKAMPGIRFVEDDITERQPVTEVVLNDFGRSLGFNETLLSDALSGSFLHLSRGRVNQERKTLQLYIESSAKTDPATFRSMTLTVPGGDQSVLLRDICDLKQTFRAENWRKKAGKRILTVAAGVDGNVLTATQAMQRLEPLFETLETMDVTLIQSGEAEQNVQIMNELGMATILAISLIFLTLVLMFDSYKTAALATLIIPLSVSGALIGHLIMQLPISLPTLIGMLGLAGVVVNDGIVMLEFLRKAKEAASVSAQAVLRLRPVLITSITTFIGLITLIFFASGQAQVLQPIAVSLGFGLLWGTMLNLIFLPIAYRLVKFRI